MSNEELDTMPTGGSTPISKVPKSELLPGNQMRRETPYWIYIDFKAKEGGEYVAEYPELGIRIAHQNYGEADRLATHLLGTTINGCVRRQEEIPWQPIGKRNPPENAEVRKIAVAY